MLGCEFGGCLAHNASTGASLQSKRSRKDYQYRLRERPCPLGGYTAYSASKAAVISLTQSLAMSLGGDNINVNAVCPGGVLTAMADAFTPDRQAMQDEMMSSRLLKRPLLPEDNGHAVVFFASVGSRMITGQALNVDGGVVVN